MRPSPSLNPQKARSQIFKKNPSLSLSLFLKILSSPFHHQLSVCPHFESFRLPRGRSGRPQLAPPGAEVAAGPPGQCHVQLPRARLYILPVEVVAHHCFNSLQSRTAIVSLRVLHYKTKSTMFKMADWTSRVTGQVAIRSKYHASDLDH